MKLWRLLSRRRRRSPELVLQIDRMLRERSALPEPNPSALLSDTRWVILDVETSGLDPRRDSLIGCIPVLSV